MSVMTWSPRSDLRPWARDQVWSRSGKGSMGDMGATRPKTSSGLSRSRSPNARSSHPLARGRGVIGLDYLPAARPCSVLAPRLVAVRGAIVLVADRKRRCSNRGARSRPARVKCESMAYFQRLAGAAWCASSRISIKPGSKHASQSLRSGIPMALAASDF